MTICDFSKILSTILINFFKVLKFNISRNLNIKMFDICSSVEC